MSDKMAYYAVVKGRNPGIYFNWDDCRAQVHQYSGAFYKKFSSEIEAENFIINSSSGSSGSSTSQSRNQSSYYKPRSQSGGGYRSDKGMWDFIVGNDGYVKVYTDGACSSNGYNNARAGIGVWFGPDHPLNVSKPAVGPPTNNRAEIQAATEAMRQAKTAGIEKLRIYTDSQFLISCIEHWMHQWKQNNWIRSNGKPVVNKNELLEMEEEMESMNIKWTHVSGHAGDYGNEMADKLAREGASQYGCY